ncbi:O-antigen polysaccharide polymerase Wzy [Carnobacterium inhibens]|uniref:O-antigen polysaccharide polymerase Wzy n=1 Tax=Carnobacterium inhibens TaxID=147709 RepID=UPI00203A9C40|nr:O-antigen polysaccharide polymerase Wzy [Carnobacterium inhibens]MCM3511378.1 O-antigen polysaccharide polymerase Wzy family protein [Carnobacterium inhibens]
MLLKSNKSNFKWFMISYGMVIISYTIYVFSFNNIKISHSNELIIFVLSWIGVLLLAYILITWKNVSGAYFHPYTIFILFLFLFNYGQPLMWAFGIHDPNEIGKGITYSTIGVVGEVEIIKAQLIILVSIIMFHTGALFNLLVNKKGLMEYTKREDNNIMQRAIFYVSIIFGLVSIPITIMQAYNDWQLSSLYGYSSLYNSNTINQSSSIISLFIFMFFPSLLGLLIGSGYDKKVKMIVYSIFIIYFIFNFLAGDRGTWIYRLFIFAFLEHSLNKKITKKTILTLTPIAVLGIYITDVVVGLRNKEINFNSVIESLSLDRMPVFSAFFEMGTSMNPTIVLIKNGWDMWPYQNTYFLAFFGMVSDKIFNILGIPFAPLNNFFSREYLGISWGAGFSIVAEALLNYGPMLAPFLFIIIGFIVSKLIYINTDIDFKKQPMTYFFALSTLDAIIAINRNSMHYSMKIWFYGVLLFSLIVLVIRNLLSIQKTKIN